MMNITHTQTDKSENQAGATIKLYSQRAIGIATYFGGPLAAGVLVRQNYVNLGNTRYGKYSLLIGIVSTIVMLAGIFSLPEHIINSIPDPLIPAVYTGIVYLVIDRLLGQTLKKHKESSGQFYSGWKAMGVGAICSLFLLAGLFGYILIASDDFDSERYDRGMADFQKNEEEAMDLFTLLETASPGKITRFIKDTGIPAWENNIRILDELDTINGLYQELKDQNQTLRKYCELRIELYELIGKTIRDDTHAYQQQIEDISQQIEVVLKEL